MMRIGQRLTIEAMNVELASAAVLRLEGSLNTLTAHAAFSALLQELHGQISSQRLGSFTIDVRRLSFVDSSAIRLFIDWVRRAKEAGYLTVFVTDETTTWHRLSFAVLKSMAPNTVEVRSLPPGAQNEAQS